MSPIEQTSKEVLAAILALGGKQATSKRLKIPVQTLTKLMKESFPGGPQGKQSRSARVKFDKAAFLSKKLSEKEQRDISQFATAMRKLMAPRDINRIKENVDDYASSKRFQKIMRAMRSNRAKGYGLRLTTYQNPNRISLQVHRPKTNVKKRGTRKSTSSKKKAGTKARKSSRQSKVQKRTVKKRVTKNKATKKAKVNEKRKAQTQRTSSSSIRSVNKKRENNASSSRKRSKAARKEDKQDRKKAKKINAKRIIKPKTVSRNRR